MLINLSLSFLSMVAGNPANVIGYVDEQDPSLTMNHGKSCQWALTL